MPRFVVETEEGLVFRPNKGAQELFVNDWETEIIGHTSGFRGGKTVGGAAKIILLTGANQAPSLLVGDTYKAMKAQLIPTIVEVSRQFRLDPHWRRSDDVILLRNWPSSHGEWGCLYFILRSAEKAVSIDGFGVGAALGDEVGRWRVDEEVAENDAYNQMIARVSMQVPYPQILLVGTHEGFGTRLYTELVESEEPNRKLYEGSTLENAKNLRSGYVDTLLSTYDSVLAEQYVYGRASEPGTIRAYYQWSDKENSDDSIAYDPVLDLWSTWDWGVNPLCMVVFQIHGIRNERVVHVIDEYVMRGSANREVLAGKFLDDYAEHPGLVVLAGDPSGYARSHRGSVDDWTYMRTAYEKVFPGRLQVKVPRAQPRVLDRVNRMNAMLCDARGTRRLFVHPKAKVLITDFQRVRRKDDALDKTYDKKLTHASDALCYPIFHEFPPVRRSHVPISKGKLEHQPRRRQARVYPMRKVDL